MHGQDQGGAKRLNLQCGFGPVPPSLPPSGPWFPHLNSRGPAMTPVWALWVLSTSGLFPLSTAKGDQSWGTPNPTYWACASYAAHRDNRERPGPPAKGGRGQGRTARWAGCSGPGHLPGLESRNPKQGKAASLGRADGVVCLPGSQPELRDREKEQKIATAGVTEPRPSLWLSTLARCLTGRQPYKVTISQTSKLRHGGLTWRVPGHTVGDD